MGAGGREEKEEEQRAKTFFPTHILKRRKGKRRSISRQVRGGKNVGESGKTKKKTLFD